ncbi:interferon regulatory factor 1-like isoform X1 [Acipenser ruthenus]|uniref:interferon regulatory factor 1-like isoform X1 n=1 Tax=Acipenser ruthenus TaxID=7906 RepID=UPI00145BA66B|nr:interferon regulatory factor 1-like isoform X1 [Acipenser ruthenus]
MPVSRTRMRPWLEKKIDSNEIPGLVWINKEKKMFQIPWKHAARHGWDLDKDACLFKQWALHTGKFKQDCNKPDPKTWKANFRCAMNSLPDIEEVKDRSINKGSSAIRVYRMLPPVSKAQRKDKKSRTKEVRNKNKNKVMSMKLKVEASDYSEHELPDDHNTYTAPHDSPTQEARVDCTDNHLVEFSNNHFEEDIISVPSDWSHTVEISTADSTNDIYTFQVSPLPSPDLEEAEDSNLHDVIQMAQELEQDQTQWQQSNINGKGFLSNAVGTSLTPQNIDHGWSDVTGEIELRFYSELKTGVDLVSYLDPLNSWQSSSSFAPVACLQ